MFSRVLPLLFVTNFNLILGFSLVFPLLPFYAREFGASAFDIALLVSAFPLMQFLLSPLWGKISDRFGRKRLIVFALAGSAISFALFGLANNFTHLLLIRLFHGATASAGFATVHAAGADISSKENRARTMGILGAAFSSAIAFGPALGGILSSISIEFPFFVSAVISLVNLLFVYFMVPETIKERTKQLKLFDSFVILRIVKAIKSNLGPAYLMTSVSYLSFSVVGVAFPLFALEKFDFGPFEVGFMFAGIGIAGALVQGLVVGKVVEKFGEAKVIRAGLVFMAVAIGLIAFLINPIFSALLLALMSVGTALINPTINTYISKRSNQQGLALGTLNSFGSLSRFLGPLAVGTIYHVYGPTVTFVSTTAVIFFGYLISLKIK